MLIGIALCTSLDATHGQDCSPYHTHMLLRNTLCRLPSPKWTTIPQSRHFHLFILTHTRAKHGTHRNSRSSLEHRVILRISLEELVSRRDVSSCGAVLRFLFYYKLIAGAEAAPTHLARWRVELINRVG